MLQGKGEEDRRRKKEKEKDIVDFKPQIQCVHHLRYTGGGVSQNVYCGKDNAMALGSFTTRLVLLL